MDYNEFVERVGWGEEFFFYYKNEKYWISRNEHGLYLTRERDSYYQAFKSSQDLFLNGTIDGKPIKDLWNLIEF
ncbi:hypothetical protein [Paenibacillus wulumuqiensis]|uniref:hypothetical protein n=1 Tax=Paenibacillus wulumuqiensis TaxID=1567107 RepID=UPI0006196CCF|nr:hypothetical protein [Paenibacillus wulumuqiensis]